MHFTDSILLFLVALIGNAQNSIAGGGTFLVFPVLLFTGMSSITANVTCAVAMWPGSIASAIAYRKQLTISRKQMVPLVTISILGGFAGALVLLHTPEKTFTYLIPYLLLAATLLFTFGTHAITWARNHIKLPPSLDWLHSTGSFFLQFAIAFYGGYFGAGIGILMLALLTLMGFTKIHEMNALKTVLATAVNAIAILTFTVAGAVAWPQAIVMIIAAIIGGYAGAHYAQKVSGPWIRYIVIATGFAMTTYFFLK